jgi:hypothetical protein
MLASAPPNEWPVMYLLKPQTRYRTRVSEKSMHALATEAEREDR